MISRSRMPRCCCGARGAQRYLVYDGSMNRDAAEIAIANIAGVTVHRFPTRLHVRCPQCSHQGRRFTDIRRRDVTKLLDTIEDNHGPRMADAVLAYVRKLCNWYQAREGDYVSPIVRGMNRSNPKTRKRKHTLNDAELRVLWKVAPKAGKFGALVIVILLSAQRREKSAEMKWTDLAADLWTLDNADREKGNAGAVRLPKAALDQINAQPKISENPFVFAAGFGKGHFNSFSEKKEILDKLLRAELPEFRPWVLHDLRRTARSLMARAGVLPHIAERTLGHAVDDIEDTYDRHEYLEEKSDALAKLAALISTIVNPPSGNVVTLAGRRKRKTPSARPTHADLPIPMTPASAPIRSSSAGASQPTGSRVGDAG
jgi:integrase